MDKRVSKIVEAFERNDENEKQLPPISSRAHLLVSSWIKKDIPLRDYLLGSVMCTTSRWLIVGQTGVGKTLLGLDKAAAIAAGRGFLNWSGWGFPRTVMYLDGELPQETFKERMELIAERYGKDILLYGYNREELGDDSMPPLNTEQGQKWLRHEIDFIKPDIIFFDSIFCLLQGSLKDEESWAPMKRFVRELTARRIAQVWFNHANDLDKSFGDKTRGWEMDTIVMLTKANPENDADTSIRLEFEKARLRVPANFEEFRSVVIRPGETWSVEAAPKRVRGGRKKVEATSASVARDELPKAYERLADGKDFLPGNGSGSKVKKVAFDALREEMIDRGFIDTDTGAMSVDGKNDLKSARTFALKNGFSIKSGYIWKE